MGLRLQPAVWKVRGPVVVVAHSLGCLVLAEIEGRAGRTDVLADARLAVANVKFAAPTRAEAGLR